MSGVGYALGQPYGYGLTEQTTIRGTKPAVATAFSFTLDNVYTWRLVGCVFTLTTDNTAGNRYVTVEYVGGDGVSFMADGAGTTVAPSSTNQRFVGRLGMSPSDFATATDVFFGLSGLWLYGGETVQVAYTNAGAADALTKIYLTFDRYQVGREPPAETDLGG